MRWLIGLVLLAAMLPAAAQTVEVPNPSFEAGDAQPVGWALGRGEGDWGTGNAAAGERALWIAGDGDSDGYWRSDTLAFEPQTVYRLRFAVRGDGAAGGTPTTGPLFANRDLGGVGDRWTTYESIFVTPRAINPDEAWLRFGQWHVNGRIGFDAVELVRAEPVHRSFGELTLGDGERIDGNAYRFDAPMGSRNGNYSRPLAGQQAGFNTHRWVFGQGSDVVYRHRLAGRRQTAGTITASIGWYSGGTLLVEVSPDGEAWREVARGSELGPVVAQVPAELLPAEEVWVRLRALTAQELGPDSDPGSFQIHDYAYEATLDGPPLEAQGETRFAAVPTVDPRARVELLGFGEGLPGGDNVLTARIVAAPGAPAPRPQVTIESPDGTAQPFMPVGPAAGGVVEIPYKLDSAGTHRLVLTLGDDLAYRAETVLDVADLYAAGFGERLPGGGDSAELWWASSGWKISRTRPAPEQAGEAVRLSLARNEAEAAQLVVRPTHDLVGLTATPSALTAPNGATLPADAVDVLRVRYVDVRQPTDATGVAAPWPDPLPPLGAGVDVPANRNQPLWLRVSAPADAAPGVYDGTVRLAAEGWSAEVPLRVEVFGFTLPKRSTVTTAFGFSPYEVFRYQKLTDIEQQREVLEKYWENFSAHRISPYDPAPLDRLEVVWPNTDAWQGGVRDREVVHGGVASLKVEDDTPTSSRSAAYGQSVPIPDGGLKLSFWYKTRDPAHEFIVTLNHHDGSGQWMSGRNNDMHVTGDGTWQRFERVVTDFPDGARFVRLTLWPALYREDGTSLGTVWYDDLELAPAAGGEPLVAGDFEPLAPDQLKPRLETAAFDAAMTRAFEHYGFNSYRLPVQGLGGGTFHGRHEPMLLGYPEGTPEYQAAFSAYLSSLQEHLRAKGWLDEAYVYWFDEPAPDDYDFVMNGFRKLKENAPDLRRMLTEQVEPALIGGPNIWCPVTPNFDPDAAAARMAAGESFWWYVCTGPKAPYATLFIDHPGTELRVWLWQTWQRGIEGVLVWQSNYWTSGAAYPDSFQNPYEDPMSWVSGYSTADGVRRPWGNGDGRFIYPPEAAADADPPGPVLDGPVDSIRWEMLRDGIEDYEYLAMLRRLLADKGAALPAADRARYEALLTVPESITADMTTFTPDPAPIEARRAEVARAVAELMGR